MKAGGGRKGAGRNTGLRPSVFQNGFTLIELLVVLVIISVLVTMVSLAIGNDRQAALEEEARRFLAVLELAGDEATLQGRDLGLHLSRRGYRFMFLEPQQEGEPRWTVLERDKLLKPREFRADIAPSLLLNDLPQTLPIEVPEHPEPQLFIFSSGERSPFKLRLANEGYRGGYELDAGPLGTPKLTRVEQ